jgi:sulfide:quinone oxidoreductase
VSHLVILGGGFGGLAAAHELRTLLGDEHEITLVDRVDEFYMGFAKLWDLAGTRPLAAGTRGLRALEDRGVRFLRAEIEAIEPSGRRVTTSQGDLEADALLVALGTSAAPAQRELLAGAGAHDLYDGRALDAMRADLERVSSGRVVVSILGGPHRCPPAPFEAALVVDRLLRDRGVRDDVEVVLTTPKPITLPVAGVDASAYVAEQLAEHGVGLLTEHPVADVDGDGRRLTFGDGTTLGYDVLLGVCADAPPPVVAASPLAAEDGWIHPDPRTLATAAERVYAVGDCTTVPSPAGQLPKAGVFAAAQAVVAARNMVADLGMGEPTTFDGHGYCFLELPGERVAFVEGDFLADPPDVSLTPADHEQFLRKQAYERDLLDRWLG